MSKVSQLSDAQNEMNQQNKRGKGSIRQMEVEEERIAPEQKVGLARISKGWWWALSKQPCKKRSTR